MFGLIAVLATLHPEEDLKVLLFFVYPITVSLRVLAGVFAGMSFLGVLLVRDQVAHGAHLGGMIAGFVYARCLLAADRKS
jgi:membrane associated rhomboid family serine protease